jgi:hypothetical protein
VSPLTRFIAWTHIVLGGMGVALAIVIGIAYLLNPGAAENTGWIIGLITLGTVSYFAPALIGGIGLLRGAMWGRIVLGVMSALILLAFPIGTLLGGVTLYAVIVKGGPIQFTAPSAQTSRVLLTMLAGLALFAAIIGLGYIFRDPLEGPKPPANEILLEIPKPPTIGQH